MGAILSWCLSNCVCIINPSFAQYNRITLHPYNDRVQYCRYIVDAADSNNLSIARRELHDLLDKNSLQGIPLLVLGNKIDKHEAVSQLILTDEMLVFTMPSSFITIHNAVLTCTKSVPGISSRSKTERSAVT